MVRTLKSIRILRVDNRVYDLLDDDADSVMSTLLTDRIALAVALEYDPESTIRDCLWPLFPPPAPHS